MLNRTASTQYNDWTGGAAFDDADFTSLSDYARKAGHIQPNDVIFGFEASYLKVSNEMTVTVSYSNLSMDDFKVTDVELSTKEFDLPLADFFDLFKRANFAVAKRGV